MAVGLFDFLAAASAELDSACHARDQGLPVGRLLARVRLQHLNAPLRLPPAVLKCLYQAAAALAGLSRAPDRRLVRDRSPSTVRLIAHTVLTAAPPARLLVIAGTTG